jgi:hypothetical protein
MFYFAGVGLAGYTQAVRLQNVPFCLLKDSCGSSGGALALAAMCAKDVPRMSQTLETVYRPGNILSAVALKGASERREALKNWAAGLAGIEGNGEVTFEEWSRDSRRMPFRVVVFNCSTCRPYIMDATSAPSVPVVDALCAATSWPALSDCHRIGDVGFCDVEFLVGPLILHASFGKPALLTVVGVSASLDAACISTGRVSRAIMYGEYYGAWLQRQESTRYPVLARLGPHVADHLFSELADICDRHTGSPLDEGTVAIILVSAAVLALRAAHTPPSPLGGVFQTGGTTLTQRKEGKEKRFGASDRRPVLPTTLMPHSEGERRARGRRFRAS